MNDLRQCAGRAAAIGILTISAACARPAPVEPPPDLILRGGKVYTLDAARTWAEAVAVREKRIVAVGTDAEVTRLAGPETRTVDLGGRFVMPAFHDAHVHPVSAGVELGQCNLNDLPTAEATLEAVRTCATEQASRAWLVGGGWALTAFPPGQPRRQELDAITGDKPAALSSSDGHSMWVNTAALAAAGITRATRDPAAGRIERDARGAPTGLLRESATDLVSKVLPATTPEEYDAGLLRALAHMNRMGIVSFQEASAREPMVAAYRSIARQGKLTVRAHLSLYADPAQDETQVDRFVRIRQEITEPGVTARTVKIFVDGVIEAATAYLIEPYLPIKGERTPAANPRGLPNFSDERLNALVTRLDREGFQAHMHAIGDGAIRQGLDAVAAAARANGPRDRRPHIAHIQLFHPDDVARFKELGVVANMQPLWAFADSFIRTLTEPRLGPERSKWLYPFGALHRAGAVLAGGSDWSVTSVNPLDAIQVAVTRKSLEAPADAPAWLPEQRLDLATALDAYTNGGAFVTFEEKDSGSLEVGKLADIIVLDKNLFEIPPEEIHKARVVWTLFEGREVFRAEGWEN
ncbi:MAG: amidohydrolase [Acidobacteria bacterium]|nr:amidohydrolase [Acidobacteriota bacterium]